MIWDQLTTFELDAIDASTPVILPIAATEQHGPHLPLATDRMIGEFMCQQLHNALPNRVLVLPSMQVGCSDHHMDFSGTLTLSHRNFLDCASDLLSSAAHHDFYNFIIFNSHGGNQGIGQVLLEDFGYENPDYNVVFTTWWRLAHEALMDITITGPGGVGHAGEFETSLMLYIAPELVRKDLIIKGENQDTFNWNDADMLRGSKAGLYRAMDEMTPNGVFGDPTSSSATQGELIVEAVVKELVQVVEDMQGL
ncbi:MAG: creatininase family protein [Bacteroidota bacterium]